MPNPSQTTAQNINYAMNDPSGLYSAAISNTATMALNDTRVRNLAVKSSGAISYGDCRWGINFPGGYFSLIEGKDYANTSLAIMTDSQLDFYNFPFTTTLISSCELIIASTGTIVFATTAGGGIGSYTWLTSGVNSDYTARVDVVSGALTSGTTGSDLALSSDRTWTCTATQNGVGFTTAAVVFDLTIKSSGTTLIIRGVTMDALAELQ